MHKKISGCLAIAALTAFSTISSAAFAADDSLSTDTVPDYTPVITSSACSNLKPGSRAIMLKTQDGKLYVESGKNLRVIRSTDKSVDLSVPVMDKPDRVLVPGDHGEGKLFVCNMGETEVAELNVSFINGRTGGKVADSTDPFYKELIVNGKPFSDYVNHVTPLVTGEVIDRYDGIEVPVDYKLSIDSTAGNMAGENAKDINTGKANAYNAGNRIAALDIRVELAGIADEPKPHAAVPSKPKAPSTVNTGTQTDPVNNTVDTGTQTDPVKDAGAQTDKPIVHRMASTGSIAIIVLVVAGVMILAGAVISASRKASKTVK